MKKYWIYSYSGTIAVVRARTVRAAVAKVDFPPALVRSETGTLTPDLWA